MYYRELGKLPYENEPFESGFRLERITGYGLGARRASVTGGSAKPSLAFAIQAVIQHRLFRAPLRPF